MSPNSPFRRLGRLRSPLTLLPLALLAGCGGGGGGGSLVAPQRRGGLVARVVWPAPNPGRVIPENAQSVRIELKKAGQTLGSVLVVRPAASATFSEIELGPLSVVSTAYASLDGTGVALATATVPAEIVEGAPADIGLTMASTVDHLDVVPGTLSLGAGGSLPFSVAAKDASGSTVLLAASALSAASSVPGLVTATGTSGAFTATAAVGVGNASLTITERDSGKTVAVPVSVHPVVTLDASTASLSVNGTRPFVATVTGPANTAVTWSVTEAGGGTVSAAGVYTAPGSRGTYHVVATSVADPARSATATVTVRSGSGTVTVN